LINIASYLKIITITQQHKGFDFCSRIDRMDNGNQLNN